MDADAKAASTLRRTLTGALPSVLVKTVLLLAEPVQIFSGVHNARLALLNQKLRPFSLVVNLDKSFEHRIDLVGD